jgi:hypothetical protein
MMKKILWALLAVVLTVNAAHAEDPAPYRGIDFSWEYGDYAACAGFNLYQTGVDAPIAMIRDRTARAHWQEMPMAVGQSMCFTMDAFDGQGNKSERSAECCMIVPLPGVKMFVVFPGVGK